jgi:DNA-directed RNA polymerase I, II, and III subunit RPABC2
MLDDGDMYFMSEKAVGTDWESSSKITLRHAAGGCDTDYLKSKEEKEKRKTKSIKQPQLGPKEENIPHEDDNIIHDDYDDYIGVESDDDTSDIVSIIVSKEETYTNMISQPKQTRAFMSKFEYAKIISIRSRQLISGMPSTLPRLNSTCVKEIAKEELRQGKLPLLIRRTLPTGIVEDWKPEELVLSINIIN